MLRAQLRQALPQRWSLRPDEALNMLIFKCDTHHPSHKKHTIYIHLLRVDIHWLYRNKFHLYHFHFHLLQQRCQVSSFSATCPVVRTNLPKKLCSPFGLCLFDPPPSPHNFQSPVVGTPPSSAGSLSSSSRIAPPNVGRSKTF